MHPLISWPSSGLKTSRWSRSMNRTGGSMNELSSSSVPSWTSRSTPDWWLPAVWLLKNAQRCSNQKQSYGFARKRRRAKNKVRGHTCLESRPGRLRSKVSPPTPTQLARSQVSDRTASSSLDHCFESTEFIQGKWSQGYPVWPSWPWGGRCLIWRSGAVKCHSEKSSLINWFCWKVLITVVRYQNNNDLIS